MRCAVFGCNNHNNKKVKSVRFHRFPENDDLRRLWVNVCCRKDMFNADTSRICSIHFKASDYNRNLMQELLNYTSKRGLFLKNDAVPSLFLPKGKNIGETKNTTQRSRERKSKKIVEDIPKEASSSIPVPSVDSSSNIDYELQESQLFRTIGTNTEEEKLIEKLQKENACLKNENRAYHQLFTSQQREKLRLNEKCICWKMEDISEAITIYSAGPRAYRLMIKKGYPFPAVSTLKKFKIAPGLLKQVVLKDC